MWELCANNAAHSPGIQLLANTSAISDYLAAQGVEAGDLIYDVSFNDVTFAGADRTIQNFRVRRAHLEPNDQTGRPG